MREWVVFSGTGLSSVLGHWVWFLDTNARDRWHHSLTAQGHFVLSLCVKGETAETIREWLRPAD